MIYGKTTGRASTMREAGEMGPFGKKKKKKIKSTGLYISVGMNKVRLSKWYGEWIGWLVCCEGKPRKNPHRFSDGLPK